MAIATHHVSRSGHAYKHAFRLNLTLISLNIYLTLCPNFILLTFTIMSEFSSLESQQDNSVQTAPEESIAVLSVHHLLAIYNHTEIQCLGMKPK